MTDISYEFIYIISFVSALFVICVVSGVFCGDSIYNKLKSCYKVEHEESKVEEV